jgi:hypothetical protein
VSDATPLGSYPMAFSIPEILAVLRKTDFFNTHAISQQLG